MKFTLFSAVLPLALLFATTTSAAPKGYYSHLNPKLDWLQDYVVPFVHSIVSDIFRQASTIHKDIGIAYEKEAAENAETETDAILKLEEQVEALNLDRNTPTRVAHAQLLDKAVTNYVIPDIRRLLQYGSLEQTSLTNALNKVAIWGNPTMTKTILADPRFDATSTDVTALTNACNLNRKTVVSILLNDSRIRKNRFEFYNALLDAVKHEKIDIVKMFGNAGVDMEMFKLWLEKDSQISQKAANNHMAFLENEMKSRPSLALGCSSVAECLTLRCATFATFCKSLM